MRLLFAAFNANMLVGTTSCHDNTAPSGQTTRN